MLLSVCRKIHAGLPKGRSSSADAHVEMHVYTSRPFSMWDEVYLSVVWWYNSPGNFLKAKFLRQGGGVMIWLLWGHNLVSKR